MPRKKRETANADAGQDNSRESFSPPAAAPPLPPEDATSRISEQRQIIDEGSQARPRSRSFKATLSLPGKGITLGERIGHDWVISFPADPGKEIKDKLHDAGFEYRDRKWKVFTHAANRPMVEALAKELKRQAGDEITVNDYPTRQVVLAFGAPPGDDITSRLREADFHFRSDMTWNADFTPANQQFARELIKSLPDMARSAAAGR